jgi:hypothetical protein
MGTSDEGTTNPWNIDDGIWGVAKAFGWGSYFSSDHDAIANWDVIKDCVNQQTPPVINLTSDPTGLPPVAIPLVK